MRCLGVYICFVAAFFLPACSPTDTYSSQAKTADSLNGAISSLVNELEKTDTLLLQKALTRFTNYSLFIRQNINDTLQKNEADDLRHFYAGGESIHHFNLNRKMLLARARLVRSQLAALSGDIKNGAQDAVELANLVAHEKEETEKLMESGHEQQRQFQSGLEEFKNSLPGVELLIRSRNRGELPVIIKDSVDL